MPALLDPPPPSRAARFTPGWGTRALLTVDTEEEFDWSAPFRPTGYGLAHVDRLDRFQLFCENAGVVPVYLVDWPVAMAEPAVATLGAAARRGTAEIGLQLHPWVNPPIEEEISPANSFVGNLPRALEREKLRRLRDLVAERFGVEPAIYRAGRYGLGPHTAELLIEQGIAIDTSVRAGFDYAPFGGADYSRHPASPWWADAERRLLELPLTSMFAGALRRHGGWLHPLLERGGRAQGLAAKAGLLERIALTPEGISLAEAVRGIDTALEQGLPLLVLSFHSPSLEPGHTPYVRSEADLDRFYDWWRGVFGHLDARGVGPTTVAEVLANVAR